MDTNHPDPAFAPPLQTPPPVSVVVVDDHALFRKGIQQLISADPLFQVVAEAASGAEGIEAILTHRPDLALIDLHMKGQDGISVIRALKAAGIQSRLIMLTVSDNGLDVMEALNAGASGYLLKDMEPDEFCHKLKQAAGGRTVLSESVGNLLAPSQPANKVINDHGWSSLTTREQETLELVSKGASNKIIARALGIAESTVKVHVKHVLQKLNLRNRFEAAVWLRERRQDQQ
ncbi:MAG: two-component system response regulator NarL [Zoogloea sp.]|uniref:two-component system response regulator NarL n=1 Tax=Zoogloea sp. TaxID=49181 RepID=UPI003F3EBE1E